jgi:cell volume regulation protein A
MRMADTDFLLMIGAILILVSILIAKWLTNIGIPNLLLFIGVGILAGSEGLGGIYFDNSSLAQSIGVIALVLILFSGGLETDWKESKPILKPAFSLATIGVILTAVITGCFVMIIFDTTFLWGLLVGSIVSSTDAAAVFSILRSGNVSLKGKLKPLLELESGSNDPMAVFLTIGTIELLLSPEKTVFNLLLIFVFQIGLGVVFGLAGGKLLIFLLNRLRFFYEGIYPVFALALAFLVYSCAAVTGGSGFLAIYIAGIVLGNSSFVHKKALVRFFDSLAVLSQITMFLTMGLLLFPSQLCYVAAEGLLLSFILIFIARPLGIFLTLIPFRFSFKEKFFTSWVGLRGAVPIILATFPLLSGIVNSHLIFNLVFFIVLTSALLQGWSINWVARLLKLSEPMQVKKSVPIEFSPDENDNTELMEFVIPFNSAMAGEQIVNLNFPDDSRIILIVRNEKNIIPSGGTILEHGDVLSVLVNKNNAEALKKVFA